MSVTTTPRTLVVNFNSPELNHLARALARDGALEAFVRPYVNKGRAWERALAALPLAGEVYASTFGRRRIADVELARLTREAGVWQDLCAAAIGRAPMASPDWRRQWTSRLYMAVREAVAEQAFAHVQGAQCVVGYEGFALPAFRRARELGARANLLNYPVAHHRQRRRVRLEENERMPEFAVTWPDFDDWPEGHEERLDAEIAAAHIVLVGSSYASDSFIREGIPASRMRIVPYGVDLQTFRPAGDGPASQRSNRFEVIYAGQLTQRKGLGYLLHGYRQFARPDSHLTLVGSIVGSDAPLRPFADLLTHVPHQTRSALAARYRASDVFVLPTLIEGMPLVVLEAMACGLPVIVTANGPAGIVRDGVDGYIVPERDPDAICDRLERLYRDPILRDAMGRQAAHRARAFSWDDYATRAFEVLSEAATMAGADLIQPHAA